MRHAACCTTWNTREHVRIALTIKLGIATACLLLLTGPASADDEPEPTDAAFADERIATLVAQLESEHPIERYEAVNALAQLGPEARVAIPRLIELLADDESGVERPMAYAITAISWVAEQALAGIGPEVAEPLALQFEAQSDEVQGRSLRVARRIGPDAREMLNVVHDYYQRSVGWQRREALCALAAIDPTGEFSLPVLLTALREDPDHHIRKTAALFLQRTPHLAVYWSERAPAAAWFDDGALDPVATADELREAMGDESPDVRAMAAIALAGYPESAERSIPLLVEMLDDRDYYWVEYSNHFEGQEPIPPVAARALAAFPEHADVALPYLIETLLDPEERNLQYEHSISGLIAHCEQPLAYINRLLDAELSHLALVALARLGTSDEAVIGTVSSLLVDEQGEENLWAAATLCCLDVERYPGAFAIVRKAFDDPDPDAYGEGWLCTFISEVGPDAEFAVPLLIENIVDGDDYVYLNYRVTNALVSIGPAAAAAVPTLLAEFERQSRYGLAGHREEEQLTAFCPAATPFLVEALNDETRSPRLHILCLRVLGRLGSDAADAAPVVAACLDSDNPRVRQTAAEALGEMADNSAVALPALERTLQDPRPLVRAVAATSIAAFGDEARHLIPRLIELLSDDYLDVQVAAARALGQFGGAAADAVPTLETLSQSDSPLLRETAAQTLEAIRKE